MTNWKLVEGKNGKKFIRIAGNSLMLVILNLKPETTRDEDIWTDAENEIVEQIVRAVNNEEKLAHLAYGALKCTFTGADPELMDVTDGTKWLMEQGYVDEYDFE